MACLPPATSGTRSPALGERTTSGPAMSTATRVGVGAWTVPRVARTR